MRLAEAMGNGASSPTKARPQQAGAGAGASLFAAATVAKKLKLKAATAKKPSSPTSVTTLAPPHTKMQQLCALASLAVGAV